MVVDTGGVITVSKSQSSVMEELDISTTIGMDGISLASREAAVARMPSMIEKQAIAAVEESLVIIFLVDGQVIFCLHIKSNVFLLFHVCIYFLLIHISI
jgi:GTP-binding protein